MGPMNKNNYQAEPTAAEIYHFAHLHPLQLSHHHHHQTKCSACTSPISTTAYGCRHCNYYLHISCSKMPRQLQHPYATNKNKLQPLMLLPKPVYPEGRFSCNACGHQGSGFSYHCSVYRIDLHVLCAALPSVTSVPGHRHQLTRVFSPPYADKKFMCDVCGEPGSKTWLYHCGSCQFDAHLGCANGRPRVFQQAEVPNVQPVFVQPANPMMYYQPVPMPVGNRPGVQILNPIVNGGLNGIFEAVAQGVAGAAIGAFMG